MDSSLRITSNSHLISHPAEFRKYDISIFQNMTVSYLLCGGEWGDLDADWICNLWGAVGPFATSPQISDMTCYTNRDTCSVITSFGRSCIHIRTYICADPYVFRVHCPTDCHVACCVRTVKCNSINACRCPFHINTSVFLASSGFWNVGFPREWKQLRN